MSVEFRVNPVVKADGAKNPNNAELMRFFGWSLERIIGRWKPFLEAN